MLRTAILAAAVLSFIASGTALAIDYASVAGTAILFETSSPHARKLAIIRAGTPVEVVVTSPDFQWVKVRDPSGTLSWIVGNALSKQRTVIVTAERASVRAEANIGAPPLFDVARDVVLDLVTADPSGWVKVHHADGSTGYLRATEVWGL